MKELFESTPGFGDVCFERYGRYPSIETLESKNVRPGNVKNLPVDSGVNPIAHGIRMNFSELRRILVEINKTLDKVLPRDGIEWLMGTLCKSKESFFKYMFIIFEILHILVNKTCVESAISRKDG